MQPSTADNQPAGQAVPGQPVDATIHSGTDAYVTDESAGQASSAPLTTAMSDALAATAAASAAATADSTGTPASGDTPGASGPAEAASSASPIFGPTPASEAIANDPLANNSTAPAISATEPSSEQAIADSVSAVVSDTPAQTPADTPAFDAASSTPEADTSVATGSDDLLNIKQDALQQLSPLVGHLEQTPEEKFRTTMMMLQATDNSALVKEAYEYAKQITDEKARAQAILDVVNEINYFTHQQTAGAQPDVFSE